MALLELLTDYWDADDALEPAEVPGSTSRYAKMVEMLASYAFAPRENGVILVNALEERVDEEIEEIVPVDARVCKIYKIEHRESGRAYVGRTWRDVQKRWYEHITDARTSSYIHRAIAKYGKDAFDFTVITTCTVEEGEGFELFYIAFYNGLSPAGYNLLLGGMGAGNFSAETRAKMSASRMGIKLSDETRAKMSLSRTGAGNPKFGKPACTNVRVAQYTLAGALVTTHTSVLLAAAAVGKSSTSLGNNAFKSTGTAYGYRWRRLEADGAAVDDIGPLPDWEDPRWRAVVQYSKDRVFIKRHDSIRAAAEAVGAASSNICAVLSGKNSTCKGFVFQYEN